MNCNYDRQMQQEADRWRGGERPPRLLLHACCAPCSSACLERLLPDFEITVFYFNPNIDDAAEYRKRVEEEKRLIQALNERIRSGIGQDPDHVFREISVIEGTWDPAVYYSAVRGLETEPEGGKRCTACFRLRLEETARVAAEGQFDFFTTTLTISPLKDAERLNVIGGEEGRRAGVRWLPSDFKKRGGYQRSIELSREYDLYRQNYCGCSFSKAERER